MGKPSIHLQFQKSSSPKEDNAAPESVSWYESTTGMTARNRSTIRYQTVCPQE
ncbi:mCG148100 [Mus musculus]|nr:mCG148100 [Mus musculus]